MLCFKSLITNKLSIIKLNEQYENLDESLDNLNVERFKDYFDKFFMNYKSSIINKNNYKKYKCKSINNTLETNKKIIKNNNNTINNNLKQAVRNSLVTPKNIYNAPYKRQFYRSSVKWKANKTSSKFIDLEPKQVITEGNYTISSNNNKQLLPSKTITIDSKIKKYSTITKKPKIYNKYIVCNNEIIQLLKKYLTNKISAIISEKCNQDENNKHKRIKLTSNFILDLKIVSRLSILKNKAIKTIIKNKKLEKKNKSYFILKNIKEVKEYKNKKPILSINKNVKLKRFKIISKDKYLVSNVYSKKKFILINNKNNKTNMY